MSQVPADPWRVSIVNRVSGRPVGAGVLLAGRYVLTCAHVVADALGVEPREGRPAEPVGVELLAGEQRADAVVVPGGWTPVKDDERGDIAVLRLLGPARVDGYAARLALAGAHADRQVRMYGHLSAHSSGWARAQMVGSAGARWEWIQLDGLGATGYQAGPGFSGAGVVDPVSRAVIGIMVAGDPAVERRVSWMIPVETIINYWPPLADIVSGRTPGIPPADPQAPEPKPAEPEPDDPAAGGPVLSEPAPAHSADDGTDDLRSDVGGLVEILLRLGGAGQRSVRDAYVAELSDRLGLALRPARYDDARRDLWSIVSATAAQPYALLDLADIVDVLHPATPETAALRSAVFEMEAHPLLTREEREQLGDILRRCRCPRTWTLHRQAVGPLGPEIRSAVTDLAAVADDLESCLDRPDGLPPLVAFLALLAQHGQGATDELGRWLDAYRARSGTAGDDALSALRATAVGAPDLATALRVRLHEDLLRRSAYLVSISRRYPDGVTRVEWQSTEPMALGEAQRAVVRAIGSVTAQPGQIEFVQFVMPPRSCELPVEQWPLDGATLGVRYPVVVTAERTGGPARREVRALRGNPDLYWSDGSVSVAVLPPAFGGGLVPPALLEMVLPALDATFVLWCRDSRAVEPDLAAMRELVTAGPLAGLPDRVLELRRAAVAGDAELGARIVLCLGDGEIWPDPAAALVAPRAGGGVQP